MYTYIHTYIHTGDFPAPCLIPGGYHRVLWGALVLTKSMLLGSVVHGKNRQPTLEPYCQTRPIPVAWLFFLMPLFSHEHCRNGEVNHGKSQKFRTIYHDAPWFTITYFRTIPNFSCCFHASRSQIAIFRDMCQAQVPPQPFQPSNLACIFKSDQETVQKLWPKGPHPAHRIAQLGAGGSNFTSLQNIHQKMFQFSIEFWNIYIASWRQPTKASCKEGGGYLAEDEMTICPASVCDNHEMPNDWFRLFSESVST